MRDVRQKGRIHAAGIGDQARSVGLQQLAESCVFVRNHVGKMTFSAGNVESVRFGLDAQRECGCIGVK